MLVLCPPCVVCQVAGSVAVPTASYQRWVAGVHIQDAWPAGSVDDREMLISGTHPGCWKILFSSESDDDDDDDDDDFDDGLFDLDKDPAVVSTALPLGRAVRRVLR